MIIKLLIYRVDTMVMTSRPLTIPIGHLTTLLSRDTQNQLASVKFSSCFVTKNGSRYIPSPDTNDFSVQEKIVFPILSIWDSYIPIPDTNDFSVQEKIMLLVFPILSIYSPREFKVDKIFVSVVANHQNTNSSTQE